MREKESEEGVFVWYAFCLSFFFFSFSSGCGVYVEVGKGMCSWRGDLFLIFCIFARIYHE